MKKENAKNKGVNDNFDEWDSNEEVAPVWTAPFADGGDKKEIPILSQSTGEVSFQEGYNDSYEREKDDPLRHEIERDKMNSLFNVITKTILDDQRYGLPHWRREDGLGNPVNYNVNARVRYEGKIYASIKNNNTAEPNDVTKWHLCEALNSDDVRSIVSNSGGNFIRKIGTSKNETITIEGITLDIQGFKKGVPVYEDVTDTIFRVKINFTGTEPVEIPSPFRMASSKTGQVFAFTPGPDPYIRPNQDNILTFFDSEEKLLNCNPGVAIGELSVILTPIEGVISASNETPSDLWEKNRGVNYCNTSAIIDSFNLTISGAISGAAYCANNAGIGSLDDELDTRSGYLLDLSEEKTMNFNNSTGRVIEIDAMSATAPLRAVIRVNNAGAGWNILAWVKN